MDIFEIEYAKMCQKELDRDIQAKTRLEWQGKRICIFGMVKPWLM
jgi:hypothetical protein